MTAPAAPLTAAGIRTAFGASLRRLRTEHGWTQSRLSALTGVSQAAISDAGAGHRDASLYTAVTLAQALGTGVDEMLGGGGANAREADQSKKSGVSDD